MDSQLEKQLDDYTTSLLNEGILNEQFRQLQSLQDESNLKFVAEVVTLFFEDSERLINELAKSLEEEKVDFKRVDAHVHQLKGSNSSIGAQKVQDACIAFRNRCDAQDIQGCVECLQEVKIEYNTVKAKFETMLKLEQQIFAAPR